MKEDSQKDVSLVYVVSGSLSVSQKSAQYNEDDQLFVLHSGEIIGGLAMLTGEPNFFTIRVKHTAWIAIVSKSNLYT